MDAHSIPSLETAGFVLIDAGVSDYDAVYASQLALVDKKKRDRLSYDYLIFVEHPEVYTYGRKSKEQEAASLPNSHFVERGGEVTYHNPGQLVCYPILSLNEREKDVHQHLRRLESTLIDVLFDFDLHGERREGAAGVWIAGKRKKIASIGVAVSSWVTFHGSALNVDNDLTGFSKINPCGFPSEVMTSMKVELGQACPGISEVKESFLRHFSRHFDRYLMI